MSRQTAGPRAPAQGRGLGKLILCGEHAVVYGHPALAVAIDRGTTVTLGEGEDQITGDPRLVEALRLACPPSTTQEGGQRVHIACDLPIGRGMGSSAALAVALVRAQAARSGEGPLTPEVVFDRALPIERLFHGNPSGLDVAVSARGGLLQYRRTQGDPELLSIPCPTSWTLVVLDSGTLGSTAQLVAQVARRRPAIDPILERIGALSQQAVTLREDLPALGALLRENHALLQQIGVSTPALDALVELAMEAGAYGAKLSGAGGGGVVLALVHEAQPLLDAARARGVRALVCRPASPPPPRAS